MIRARLVLCAARHHVSHGGGTVVAPRPPGTMTRVFSVAPAPPELMDERTFHVKADAAMARIEAACGSAFEDTVDGFDISSAMGVLTIKLGAKGTYVLNKQSPNKQIWWSSPVSGPRRYQWAEAHAGWRSTRDGHDMLESLVQELHGLTGQAVEIGGKS